ncbi:MAG: hypothetical protein K940chlam1_00873 [Candidatus Anoxychlamydiales bacterium]|nr:hypothetical protein [Candidatus Anoxychlamydiales bacterium]
MASSATISPGYKDLYDATLKLRKEALHATLKLRKEKSTIEFSLFLFSPIVERCQKQIQQNTISNYSFSAIPSSNHFRAIAEAARNVNAMIHKIPNADFKELQTKFDGNKILQAEFAEHSPLGYLFDRFTGTDFHDFNSSINTANTIGEALIKVDKIQKTALGILKSINPEYEGDEKELRCCSIV